jgi:hypothetical protein
LRALRIHGSGEGGRLAYNLLYGEDEKLEETAGTAPYTTPANTIII